MPKHLPSFSIVYFKQAGEFKKREVLMQGWALPRDAKLALKALQRAYPGRHVYMEDE